MTEENIIPDSTVFTYAVVKSLSDMEEGKYGVETFCTIIQNQIYRQAIDILVKQNEESSKINNIFDEFAIAAFNVFDNLDTKNKEECKQSISKLKELMTLFNIPSLRENKEESKTK